MRTFCLIALSLVFILALHAETAEAGFLRRIFRPTGSRRGRRTGARWRRQQARLRARRRTGARWRRQQAALRARRRLAAARRAAAAARRAAAAAAKRRQQRRAAEARRIKQQQQQQQVAWWNEPAPEAESEWGDEVVCGRSDEDQRLINRLRRQIRKVRRHNRRLVKSNRVHRRRLTRCLRRTLARPTAEVAPRPRPRAPRTPRRQKCRRMTRRERRQCTIRNCVLGNGVMPGEKAPPKTPLNILFPSCIRRTVRYNKCLCSKKGAAKVDTCLAKVWKVSNAQLKRRPQLLRQRAQRLATLSARRRRQQWLATREEPHGR